ncbi:MAG: hypothetical protein RL266_1083 [Bacteroidota bacterium]
MVRSFLMLSDQLGHIISEQLRDQPLVVLPGFGGFVKDHIGAELDELRNRIHPPKKTVVFNARLSHNDGMLLAAYAGSLEITYAQADKLLTDAITELRFKLDNGETVVWEGLGKLQRSVEDNLVFEAVSTPQIQDEFFGLKPIALRALEKDNVDRMRELVAADGPVASKIRTLPVKRIASYAAAAVTVGFLMWMPIQNGVLDNGKMLAHQFNPFATNSQPSYSARQFNENWIDKGFEREDVLSEKYSQAYISLYLTGNSANAIVVKTDAIPSSEVQIFEEENISAPTATATSFKVIAATFKTRSEATEHVAKMITRGFGAEYAGQDANGHLVAYGSYSSLEDAKKMLASVSLSNKEARIVSE